ncbi:dCTP pyrophosphatase 1 [Emydura macquarii macquarii]|uniref:dCTP pyrophosphatase 1 n=1 Tax=Emydura macquarii macquarii TaxID=1129001 RepID=UPI00352B5898
MEPGGGSEGAASPAEISESKDQGAEGGTPGGFTFSANPCLEDIRRLQAEFVAERGWGRFHQPRNLLLALVGEVGEVAELFQWRAGAEAQAGLPGWTPGERLALAEELSDVLLYLVSLAQQCRVDLPRAALHKLDRNRARYPASRAHGSARKYTHYQDGAMDAGRCNGPTDTCHQDGATDTGCRDGATDARCWDRLTDTCHQDRATAAGTEPWTPTTVTDGRAQTPAARRDQQTAAPRTEGQA